MSEALQAGEQRVPQPPPATWRQLAARFRSGQLIPFLGAGASAYCRNQDGGAPPGVRELVSRLAADAALNLHCGKLGCQFDLSRLASYYQTVVGTRLDLDRFLRSEIGNPAFNPNPLHYLLARIARNQPMLIVTTNYDDLLERAFDEPKDGQGPVPYELLVTPVDDLAYGPETEDSTGPEHAGGILHWTAGSKDFARVADSDLRLNISERSVIYKIHGSIPRGPTWQGGYLIAEEDYARFLGRMDRAGLIPGAVLSHIVKKTRVGNRALPHYSILFLGYGMHDWNLRVLLEELHVGRRAPNEEKHYAFVLGPDPIEQNLFRIRNITVYDCDLTHFVDTIGPLIP